MKIILLVAFLLSVSSVSYAEDESIELTTYYPAPYGDYDELSANEIKLNPHNSPSSAAGNEGNLYYDATENQLQISDGTNYINVGVGGGIDFVDQSSIGYIRLGDFQMCWGRGFFAASSPATARRYINIIFQMPFISIPAVSVTPDWPEDVFKVGVSRNTLTNNGFSAMTQSDQSTSGGWGFSWVAVGRWR